MESPRKSPLLLTPRLTVRMLDEAEAFEVARFHRVNQAHLEAFSPRAPEGFFTEDFWRVRIGKCREDFQADLAVSLFLFESGKPQVVAGTISFTQISRGPAQSCMLGYKLGAEFQGQGLMTEALKSTIAYTFGELNLHRIQASYLTDNHRSGAVLERLGFESVGIARDYLRIDGRWRDHFLTAKTNPAWRET